MEAEVDTVCEKSSILDDLSATRRDAFIAAAREAFFAHGYSGTSMSSIASKVGGSKTTLWSCFRSKEELFAAVVEELIEEFGAPLAVDLPLDAPVTEVLELFGKVLIGALMLTPLLSLYRLVVGEAERFPHLAETFHDRAPRRGRIRLAEWMSEKMIRGDLRVGDPMLAVCQFAGLCKSDLYNRAVLGLIDEKEIQERLSGEVAAAVDTFYRAWGPR